MHMVRGTFGQWLEKRLAHSISVTDDFYAKLTKAHSGDDGDAKLLLVEHAISWSYDAQLEAGAAVEYAALLASYTTDVDVGELTSTEWVTKQYPRITAKIASDADFIISNSSMPSKNINRDGRLMAIGKIFAAMTWVMNEAAMDREEDDVKASDVAMAC